MPGPNYRCLASVVQRTVGLTSTVGPGQMQPYSSHCPVNLSDQKLPRNVEELNESHMGRIDQSVSQSREVTARELELSQTSR